MGKNKNKDSEHKDFPQKMGYQIIINEFVICR